MAYTDVCGRKLQSKLGGILNESATSHSPALLSSEQSFAKRQLEKMGWTEGTGLGKNRTGMKEHVKIKKREDAMGLGREKELAKEVANVWWKDSVGGTLARLQQQKKDRKKSSNSEKDDKKKRKKDKKKKSKKESLSSTASAIKTYTDEELFEATGGARFGMRAQRRAEGKWKRTESGTELAELEEKARKDMEWNGRGSAKVLIEGKTATSKKRKQLEEEEDVKVVSPSMSDEELDAATGEEEKRAKKKRRKLEKESQGLHQVSPLASDEDAEEVVPEDEESKKKKHKKKSKKRSKKEKQP